MWFVGCASFYLYTFLPQAAQRGPRGMGLSACCFTERLQGGTVRAAQHCLHLFNFSLLPFGYVLSPLTWGWQNARPGTEGRPNWSGVGPVMRGLQQQSSCFATICGKARLVGCHCCVADYSSTILIGYDLVTFGFWVTPRIGGTYISPPPQSPGLSGRETAPQAALIENTGFHREHSKEQCLGSFGPGSCKLCSLRFFNAMSPSRRPCGVKEKEAALPAKKTQSDAKASKTPIWMAKKVV